MPLLLTAQNFFAVTTAWSEARDTQCRYYWPVKGGWEGWIQVDLVAYILQIDSTIEVEREQSIYEQPRQRVDLLINAPSADVKEWIPVEIKAESLQNHTNFIPGVLDDLAKIERQRRHPFDQATSVMIAIAFSQEEEGSALKALMNIKVRDNPIFAVVHQGEIACCVAVWDGPSRGWIQQ